MSAKNRSFQQSNQTGRSGVGAVAATSIKNDSNSQQLSIRSKFSSEINSLRQQVKEIFD